MSEDLDPLPKKLEALFAEERAGQHVSSERAARMLRRLEASYSAQVASLSSAPHASGLHALAGKHLAAFSAAVFGAGAVAGAGVGVLLTRSKTPPPPLPQPSIVAPVAPASSGPPVASPLVPATEVAPPPRAPVRAPKVASPPPAKAESAPVDADLESERKLLEVARSALERGNAEAALAAVEHHRAAFPKGRLAEERDALQVQALLAAGDRERAAAAAAAFLKTYPDSLFAPAVRAAASVP